MKQLINDLNHLQVTTLDEISLWNILAAEYKGNKYIFNFNKHGNISLTKGSMGWDIWPKGYAIIDDLFKVPGMKIFVFDSLDELADWIKSK